MPFVFDSSLHCRDASEDDIPDMTELLRQLFSIEKDFEIDQAKQRVGLQMLLHSCSAKIFVAEKQGHVIGMCTLQTLVSTAEGDYVGLIEDVVVSEEFRRQGIGSLLLETATEWAERNKLKRLQLLADMDNYPAMKFYQKYGWGKTNLIGIRKKL